MTSQNNKENLRILFLVANQKLAQKASSTFLKAKMPINYQLSAVGTAPSELIDVLGLGSIEKRILISVLPKTFADQMMLRMKKELRLGTTDSGIAFTLMLTGANKFVLMTLDQAKGLKVENKEGDNKMEQTQYSLIAVVINQGYSEKVMDVAREAGAFGGTVVHGRHFGDKEATGVWGVSIQEEKEILFIVSNNKSKLDIMQAIGEKCGMKSEIQGMVLSLPIDSVMGID